ncbi:MAG: ATP-binding protein [Bacteroidota bacterium]
MIPRLLSPIIHERLAQFPAVALLGPRQVGKTTLAILIAKEQSAVYLDLETPEDREKLSNPKLYLEGHRDKLVIMDEVHRVPELFQELRGIIDEGIRSGRKAGQFLFLGSASMDLLKQTGESLAGRIAYVELNPLNVLEVPTSELNSLWQKGGFPDSFLAKSNQHSFIWRQNFIRTYLERDIPLLGPRIPAETLRRFWTMLAHKQGSTLNASQLARGLAVDGKTIANYLDLLVDLLLVRRLIPFHKNIGKRLVKSPKIYVRDSGVLHALLGIHSREGLYAHPSIGMSWEGFVIDNLLQLAPDFVLSSFFRTQSGAEIDLLLEFPGGEIWAIEIKRSLSPKLEKGFYFAHKDIQPSKSFVVYPGEERYFIHEDIEVISLRALCQLLLQLS